MNKIFVIGAAIVIVSAGAFFVRIDTSQRGADEAPVNSSGFSTDVSATRVPDEVQATSQVQYFLHGTVDTGDSDTSSALILSSADSEARIYRVGDELPGGDLLYLVTADTAQVMTNDALIELRIVSTGYTSPGASSPVDSLPSSQEEAIAAALANMRAHGTDGDPVPSADVPQPAAPVSGFLKDSAAEQRREALIELADDD